MARHTIELTVTLLVEGEGEDVEASVESIEPRDVPAGCDCCRARRDGEEPVIEGPDPAPEPGCFSLLGQRDLKPEKLCDACSCELAHIDPIGETYFAQQLAEADVPIRAGTLVVVGHVLWERCDGYFDPYPEWDSEFEVASWRYEEPPPDGTLSACETPP